jgi:tetratricopeptide (TPR) repeat protein
MPFAATLLSLTLIAGAQSPQAVVRGHYEAAEARARAGDLAGAETEYGAVLAEAYWRLSKIYSARRRPEAALEALEHAARWRPRSDASTAELALAYLAAGKPDKALSIVGPVVAADPRNVVARRLLGKAYYDMRDFARAAAEWRAALELEPNDVETGFTLGLAHLQMRDLEGAKRVFAGMVERLGDRPPLRTLIGRAYRDAGLFSEAVEEFRRALALDPSVPRGRFNLGLTYLREGGASRLREAEAEFRAELAANPDEYFATYYLGILALYQSRWEAAVAIFEKAAALRPDNPDPYFQLSQALQELGRHDRAVEVLQKSIALTPDLAHNKFQLPTAHYRLSQSLLRSGRAEEGRKMLAIAAELKAQAFQAEQAMSAEGAPMGGSPLQHVADADDEPATAAGERGRQALEAAEDYFAKVAAAAHNSIGLLRARGGDFAAAAEQFVLAARWNPDQEGLRYNLALSRFKMGAYAEAVTPLEEELRAHPANEQARRLLAEVRARLSSGGKK